MGCRGVGEGGKGGLGDKGGVDIIIIKRAHVLWTSQLPHIVTPCSHPHKYFEALAVTVNSSFPSFSFLREKAAYVHMNRRGEI